MINMTCCLKPEKWVCSSCLDEQVRFDFIYQCDICPHHTTRYKIVSLGTGLFGTKAVIMNNDKLMTVSMDRLFNIEGECEDENR